MKMLHLLSKSMKTVFIISLLSVGFVQADPVKFEAVIVDVADRTLKFKDESAHIVRLVHREGKVTGDAPFAGTKMMEWGIHDMIFPSKTTFPTGDGYGYLIFTQPDGNEFYLKFNWVATAIKDEKGKASFILSGHWKVEDPSHEMTGLGTLRISILSPKERHWEFEGEMGH